MGGIVDYGVSITTKSSPRSVAIEKAQEELRQEYDVREEQRRELEFLEKGGNPLDFKFGHVESVSMQSTSITDQIAEQNVISEAKGSFVFAASPHGDSVESSGKPGSSLCRETNTADNLMLFGGDNNDSVKEKIVKRGSRRTNAAQLSQSSDRHNNAKKAQDSGLSRLGVKSQAYVRRNRSKPCRESANVASIISPVVPAKGSEPKDAKGAIKEKQPDDIGVLSGSSLNQVGPKCENAPTSTASDEHVAMELDGIQTIRENCCIVKSETRQGDNNSKATEGAPNGVNDNQLPDDGFGEIAAAGASTETPDATSEVVLRTSCSSASRHNERETCADDEKVDGDHLDKGMAHNHLGELDNSSIIPVCAVQAASLHKSTMDPPCEDMTSIIDNHADGNNLVATKVDRKSHEDVDSRISGKGIKEGGQLEGFCRPTSVKENSSSVQPEVSTTVHIKDEMEVCNHAVVAQKDRSCPSPGHSMNNERSPALEKINSHHGDSNTADPIVVGSALITLPDSMPSLKVYGSSAENEIQKSGENLNKMATKEYEDSILRKACLIEVGLKRACERSLCNISLEKRRKGHWDFVLEEMAWMANDFMQERLWRSMAASQVCHWIASDGLAKFDQASIQRKQKTVIKSLAKGVMSFWCSAEALLTTGGTAKVMQTYDSNMMGEIKPTGIKAENEQGNESMETEQSMRPRRSQIQDYAVRFLEYNSHTSDSIALAEAPRTPDRLSDFGILKVSDQLSQGSLFYAVPAGAMLAYRESVESLFMYHKRAGNIEVKYDYEASVCDSAADLTQENAYEEDEGKTFTYLLPEAYDGGLLSKMGHKKKHIVQQRMNGARPYEVGTDVPYEPCLESKSGNRQLFSNGKRPSSSFLAIPTKRIRTAARQRVVSPFPASVGGTPQVTSKTDVSSGDSYQDDQSSLHGGSLPWKNLDYESTVDFDRQLPYDGSEAWTKANKKKKHKNPGHKTAKNAANSCASALVKGRIYDQRSQVDFTQYEQKDYLKRRSETQQFYSNGTIVANGGQHASKKLKMMRQGVDISQEASPVASQMSNMTNPAKIIKIITNRDHGRKVKALKMSSGGGWSNFEDQALVVLVHDMGQNWELVSDAINSIVQFKSVHRQPKECKERHKVLVDRSSGDGADSAEDSGSSQHYHFTIPGIPKGSARQLFRRLQGPFEEENLKSHFEKVILLMPQVQSRRRQVNSREPKPIVQPHSSHVVALSQACPNNLSGGTLSPFDLCDAISSNLDTIAPSHTNGLTLPNHHGSVGPTTTTSNPNSRLPGSPGMVLGSNLPSPSTSTAPSRDAQKYGVPRSTSLQGDEQQKIQYQYNQVVSGRNLHQPGGSVAGTCPGVDRGARMMPGAHGIGMTTGVNRGMPAARAGFPRVSSPGMPNMVSPGNMLSSNGQGVPNAVRVHSGATSAPGNSILRPRDPMQMLRPGQHMEEHRQMVKPEFHMQVSQGSSQAVQFSSMNPSFSNAAASLPVQQTQKPHQMSQPSHMFGNPQGTSHSSPQQQQGYGMHLGKERQFQQRMVPQQHNDLSGASAVPSVQNGSQIQQQNQASAATSTPSSQPRHQRQQSEQHPPDSSALPNQPANATQPKQKKQQGQQQPRQNQQQRNQGSQQAKLMKSLGRGNMLIPQTPPVDATPASAVSTPSKKQVSDKNLMQHGQGSSPGNKASISSGPQHGNQHKLYTSPLPQSPKEMPDIGNQDLMQGSPSPTLLAPQQPPLHSKSPLTTQQRQINASQNIIKRMMMQQNLQMNSDRRTDSQLDQVQHNQVIPTPPISHDTEPGSPGLSSINQRKHEASTSKLLSSPKDNFVGNETSLPSSSQDALQRQISGGLPMHAQDVGGQWHQQQSREHLQSPHHQQPQHQQRPAVQGSLYAPSNSGPG